MEFWTELEQIRRRWNVLEHPFYTRWTEGLLLREELAHYAGEYHHAAAALAEASRLAAQAAEPAIQDQMTDHAAEEAEHVQLWNDFASAVGGEPAPTPASETAECAEAWGADDGRSFLERLVTLYAIESAQPAIAKTKADGLRAHYGFQEGPATAYFDLHATLDHEHAAEEKALIEPRLVDADPEKLLAAAERALQANWKLLDGVERHFGREPGERR